MTGDLDTRRPFTRGDAIAAGIDPRLLRGKRFRRIFKGVYISADVPFSPLHSVEAAVALHPPGAFASHASAARLYDVPVPHYADEHVSVFAETDRRRRAAYAAMSRLVPPQWVVLGESGSPCRP